MRILTWVGERIQIPLDGRRGLLSRHANYTNLLPLPPIDKHLHNVANCFVLGSILLQALPFLICK